MEDSKTSWIDKDSWKSFIKTIFTPWIIILVLAVFFIIRWSIDEANKLVTNNLLVSLLSVFISILSGIVGAILYKRWTDFTESGKLAVRGKSAIRNLKMLLNNITQLREKVITFICPRLEKEHSKETPEIFMREIIDRCTNLQEETVNSIENWTDITPEAEIKTEIGEISKLQMGLIEREKELAVLRKEKAVSAEVEQKIKGQTEAWQNLLEKIKERQNKIDINVPSTGVGYSSEDMWRRWVAESQAVFEGKCRKCGAPYHCALPMPLDHNTGLCAKCQSAGCDENDNKE
jgi:hypothetical protein